MLSLPKSVIVIALIFSASLKSQTISVNPNPFSKRTLINYTIVSADTISIGIYNQIGQFILSVRNNYIVSAGSYQDSLIMDSFPDGIYLLICMNKQQKKLGNAKIVKSIESGIKKLSGELSLKYYPNPTEDRLIIEATAAQIDEMNLSITNFSGEEIYNRKVLSQKEEIDLRDFSSGIYFFNLRSGSEQSVFKVVKK